MVSIRKLQVGLLAFLFFIWVGTPLAWADDSERPWKKFSIKLGGYVPIHDTNVRVDGKGGLGLGTEIDFENDLGLEEELSTYRIDAQWRFFDRHRLNFSFFDLTRDATTSLRRNTQIGDILFPTGDILNSKWEHKVYVASYTWSFLQTNKYEVGLNIGAHITRLKLQVVGQGIFGLTAEVDAVTVPLPVLGLTGAYAFTPKLVLKTNVGAFYLKIDEYEGSLVNFDLDLEYNAWKYMGFGVGYNFFRLNLDLEADKFHGSLEYQYHGFKVFLKFYL
jgi:hypothetical protein